MKNLLEPPLRKAIGFLEANNYRYAIIGGIALAQWGVLRATHDVDIKVLVPDLDFAVVRKTIQQEFLVPARTRAQPNPFIVSVNIDGVIVDFLLSLPGYEENIITRAIQRDLGGWIVWICSAEDLIIQKIIAGRAKDMEDVEGLWIEQRDKIDETYIEDWLTQFADALEKPELITNYRKLKAEINGFLNVKDGQ
jgi:predicted nucleotidyltransferase